MAGCCGGGKPAGNEIERHNGCTDIIFLLFFIAFWIGMVIIAGIAMIQGDPRKILAAVDSFGNNCGVDNSDNPVANVPNSGRNSEDEPYLFFLNLLMPNTSIKICVSQCPNETLFTMFDVRDFYDKTGTKLCIYNIDTSEYTNINLYVFEGSCPLLPILSSLPALGRCLPHPEYLSLNVTVLRNAMEYLNKGEFMFRQIIADLYSVWKDIIYLSLVAVGLSIIMQFFMKCLACIILYFTMLASTVSSIGATIVLWVAWRDIRRDRIKAQENFDALILEIDVSNETAFLILAVSMSVFTVVLLLTILVLFKRLQLIITIFGEAAKCVVAMPLLLLTPLFTLAVLIPFAAGWVIVFTFIHTIDKAVPLEVNNVTEVVYESLGRGEFFFWYYVVGGIWGLEFLVAAEQFVIVSSVAIWFFNRSRPRTPLNCIVCRGACRFILYHIGTVAMGSFILTLVKLPRYQLMYMYSQLKNSPNYIAQLILKCLICCVFCVENMLKYINKNAYIITAVEGKSYCSAAARAFVLLVSNAMKIATLNSVGAFMFFCAKIAVVTLTTAISVLWFRKIDGLHFYALPVVIVSILSFFIAHSLINIYGTICDALMLCFCIDCEINDGSAEKPYYMDIRLMSFVLDTSKQLNATDGRVQPEENEPKK